MRRRRTVRGRIVAQLPVRVDGRRFDPIAEAPSTTGPAKPQLDEAIGVLETAVAELPARQQQALSAQLRRPRCGPNGDTMGCSEGSVRTHYFRARNLRASKAKCFKVA